ncbi:MAG: hypothetical protein DBX59_05870, partial [Bacillota bacterium]
MKKTTKNIIQVMVIILVVVGILVGTWYFILWGVGTSIAGCQDYFSKTEPEDRTNGDFVYHILSGGVIYDHNIIAIVGLSEEGKTKKEILIPQEIDGLPVEFLGYEYGWAGRKGEFESDVLEKLYLMHPIESAKGRFSELPAYKCTVIKNGAIYEGLGQQDKLRDTKMPKSEWLKLFGDYNRPDTWVNVVYYLNDETDTVHFADDLDGEKITFIPPEPTREDYIFGGWYKESECITAWDFENDVVPAKEYDDEGNYLFQETALYAKW